MSTIFDDDDDDIDEGAAPNVAAPSSSSSSSAAHKMFHRRGVKRNGTTKTGISGNVKKTRKIRMLMRKTGKAIDNSPSTIIPKVIFARIVRHHANEEKGGHFMLTKDALYMLSTVCYSTGQEIMTRAAHEMVKTGKLTATHYHIREGAIAFGIVDPSRSLYLEHGGETPE